MLKDKFEARNLEKKCNFIYHSLDFDFPKDRVTSVGAIVFNNVGDILTVELKRGFDIPGGHIQEGDTSFEAALKREILEEAYVYIENVKLSLVVESDYFGNSPEEKTFMLFYTARVGVLKDFVVNNESISRKFMSSDELIEFYKGDRELILNIIISSII